MPRSPLSRMAEAKAEGAYWKGRGAWARVPTTRRNRRVAFVVDDLASVDPWLVRGIEIRGDAEILETGGQEIVPGFDPEMFRIRPRRIISWGLDQADSFTSNARSVP